MVPILTKRINVVPDFPLRSDFKLQFDQDTIMKRCSKKLKGVLCFFG